MCIYLTEKNSTPKVARKDIVCYKLVEDVRAYGRYSKIAYTPFMGYCVSLGETYDAMGQRTIHEFDEYDAPHGCYTHYFSEGGIHTFKTLEGVEKFCNGYSHTYGIGCGCSVVKCIIRKGTEYFSGVFEGTRIPCYASSSLTYTEEIVKDLDFLDDDDYDD